MEWVSSSVSAYVALNQYGLIYCVFTISGPCFDLPPLMNGGIIYNGGLADSRPINTVAFFTCDNGYTLTGGSFKACQNDSTWDRTTPTCQGEFSFTFFNTVK